MNRKNDLIKFILKNSNLYNKSDLELLKINDLIKICDKIVFKKDNERDNTGVDYLASKLLSEKYNSFSSEKLYSLIKILRRLNENYLNEHLYIVGNCNFYSLIIDCDNFSMVKICCYNNYYYG